MASLPSDVNIIDIRAQRNRANDGPNLRDQIAAGLSKPTGQKTLPSILVYDERGLRLFDDISQKAPEYYLFPAEESILRRHGEEIAQAMLMHAVEEGNIGGGGTLVELGAGALRKTSLILLALAGLVSPSSLSPITYYALDLEERELVRTLKELNASAAGLRLQGRISTRGLCGTYEEGFEFIRSGGLAPVTTPHSPHEQDPYSANGIGNPQSSVSSENHSPLHILFLGSSLGNFARGEDAVFLRSLPLRPGSRDTLVLGLDHDNNPEDIMLAYHDPKGVVGAFILNGLRCAGRVLGDEALFADNKWSYAGRYDQERRNHLKLYKSLEDQTVVDPVTGAGYSFEAGELVHIMDSHKYSDHDTAELFTGANLRPIHRWVDSSDRYSLWLLERRPSD